jgi:hypothetical protein
MENKDAPVNANSLKLIFAEIKDGYRPERAFASEIGGVLSLTLISLEISNAGILDFLKY